MPGQYETYIVPGDLKPSYELRSTRLARPSTKEKRRQEILDAFEVCVARYGIEGATLERIAETAQLARPLIRHNIGNRDDLIDVFLERFVESSKSKTREIEKYLPDRHKANALVAILFDDTGTDNQSVLVASALVIAGATNKKIADTIRDWTTEFVAFFSGIIEADFPSATKNDIKTVATGIVGIYFNYASLKPLGQIQDVQKHSKNVVERLIASLK